MEKATPMHPREETLLRTFVVNLTKTSMTCFSGNMGERRKVFQLNFANVTIVKGNALSWFLVSTVTSLILC